MEVYIENQRRQKRTACPLAPQSPRHPFVGPRERGSGKRRNHQGLHQVPHEGRYDCGRVRHRGLPAGLANRREAHPRLRRVRRQDDGIQGCQNQPEFRNVVVSHKALIEAELEQQKRKSSANSKKDKCSKAPSRTSPPMACLSTWAASAADSHHRPLLGPCGRPEGEWSSSTRNSMWSSSTSTTRNASPSV